MGFASESGPRNIHHVSPGQRGYCTPHVDEASEYGQHLQFVSSAIYRAHIQQQNHSKLTHKLSLSNKIKDLPWRERVKHYTWTYFTMTMATGGIANVLHQCEDQNQRLMPPAAANIHIIRPITFSWP